MQTLVFKCEAGHIFNLETGVYLEEAASLTQEQIMELKAKDLDKLDKFTDWAMGHDKYSREQPYPE